MIVHVNLRIYIQVIFFSFYIFLNSQVSICQIGRKQLRLSLPWEYLVLNNAKVGLGVGPCWLVLFHLVVLRCPLFCCYRVRPGHGIIYKIFLVLLSQTCHTTISSFWELLRHWLKGPLCIQSSHKLISLSPSPSLHSPPLAQLLPTAQGSLLFPLGLPRCLVYIPANPLPSNA